MAVKEYTPPKIELEHLYNITQNFITQHPLLRAGQALYSAYYSEVIVKQTHRGQFDFNNYIIDHKELDPFYSDKNMHNFVKWVTGKNDSNAWKCSFENLVPQSLQFTILQPKVYCITCEYYVRPDWCSKVLTIEDTPRERIPHPTPISKVNKNNDCKQYRPTLSLRIFQWLKRITKHD